MKTLNLLLLLCCSSLVLTAAAPSSRLPDATLNLKLTAPITTWDEAIPLGNGTMGVLLWGESNTAAPARSIAAISGTSGPRNNISPVKDRFTWARHATDWSPSNRMDEFNEVFDSNYDYDGPPTKLPAGRVEIVLDPSQTVEILRAESGHRRRHRPVHERRRTPRVRQRRHRQGNRSPSCAFPALPLERCGSSRPSR